MAMSGTSKGLVGVGCLLVVIGLFAMAALLLFGIL